MSDERLKIHIADWIKQLNLPATVELRCRDEVIDSVTADSSADFGLLASDLLEASATDAADEGKTRAYTLVAIDADSLRFVCPLRIRRRVDKSAGELLAALARQNAELHACLVRKDRESAELLLRHAQSLVQDRQQLVDELSEHRKRATETIDKLEALRSKALERDMAIESHKADLETKERLTDAAIPLAMAIAGRLTGGQVKSDIPTATFVEVVKSLNENQLDAMRSIVGDREWQELSMLLDGALSNAPNVQAFKDLVGRMPTEKQMTLFQVLNMGQQAALKELLNGSN